MGLFGKDKSDTSDVRDPDSEGDTAQGVEADSSGRAGAGPTLTGDPPDVAGTDELELGNLLDQDDGDKSDGPSPTEDNLAEGLMDIFTEEETVDEDLAVLTDGLNHIDVASILDDARRIAVRLRDRTGA